MKKYIWILIATFSLITFVYGIAGGLWISYEEKALAKKMTAQAEIYKNEGNIAEATSEMEYAVFHGELANDFQKQGLLSLGGAIILAGISFVTKKKLS